MAVRCTTHSSNIQSFCNNCNKLVCLKCMEGKSHNGHEYTNLKDLLETRQKYLHTIENLEIDLDAKADAEQQKLVQRAESLQLSISNIKTKLSEDLKENVSLQKEFLTSRKKDYQNEIRLLERILDDSTSPADDEASDGPNIICMSSSPPHGQYFVPSFQYDNESDVSEVFGRLQDEVFDSGDADFEGICEESTSQDDPIPTESVPVDDAGCLPSGREIDRNSFKLKSKHNGVVRICASSFKNSWIATCGAKGISLYAKGGSHIKTIKTPFEVFDIALFEKKFLYATEKSGCRVMKIAVDAVILKWTKQKVFPVDTVTYGIHVNHSGDVWVCLQKKDLERKLVRISESIITQIIEFNSEGTQLFNSPTFVHQNSCTGDILVVDHNTVIVVDKLGRPAFNITSDNVSITETNKDVNLKPFIPLGLANDKEGNIIISDVGNNRVWMFDRAGNLIRSLSEELNGLSGIAVHSEEEIWVAMSNRKIAFIQLCEEP